MNAIEPSADPLLSIRQLTLDFETFEGTLKVLTSIEFSIQPGETVGVVGETGCGKSVLAKSILGLVPKRTARFRYGSISWNGEDILSARAKRLRQIRGTEIGMVFQDPMTFLDPLYTAGSYLQEAVLHRDQVLGRKSSKAKRRDEILELLARLQLPDPKRVYRSYPHQLSGGMRQRVLIAAAIAGNPRLLIADEPTTALDVTVQAQILRILRQLVTSEAMSLMLISHDLGVIAAMCDRIAVMYAGAMVEVGEKAEVLTKPLHPYTIGLIAAVPRLGYPQRKVRSIAGQIPNLLEAQQGCHFAPRCPRASDICRSQAPKLEPAGSRHLVACHHPGADHE